jgi:hypothetical protein
MAGVRSRNDVVAAMSVYVNLVKAYLERYQCEVDGDGLLDPLEVAART